MMDRRCFLLASLAGVFGAPPAPDAQQGGKVARVGVLLFLPLTKRAQEDFRSAFRDHGYAEGQHVLIEWRSAEGSTDRANALAAELVGLNVGVIVAEFTPAVRAAKNATTTIPIVMASAGDPVATGLVSSLAHPGGNITGFTNLASELSGKRLELLREVVPGVTRVGMLIHGSDPLDGAFVDETRAAAAKIGIQVHVKSVPRPEDLDGALSALTKERVGAAIVLANVAAPARQVALSALRHRLPSISLLNQFAEAGGLMSYGASVSDIRRRAVSYVDKILKGAKPADLPVERPTKFDLVINLKTAKALGVTIPPSLLLRADQVIE
jgi:putative ABC transport system substrate-binding protein